MNAYNLESMSMRELKQLQEKVAIAIYECEKKVKKEAQHALEMKARELGFNLADFVETKGRSDKGKKAPPKYADPENPSNTWSGRGRKPKWLQGYLSAGKNIEDLKI